jgi:hypothetical protein
MGDEKLPFGFRILPNTIPMGGKMGARKIPPDSYPFSTVHHRPNSWLVDNHTDLSARTTASSISTCHCLPQLLQIRRLASYTDDIIYVDIVTVSPTEAFYNANGNSLKYLVVLCLGLKGDLGADLLDIDNPPFNVLKRKDTKPNAALLIAEDAPP